MYFSEDKQLDIGEKIKILRTRKNMSQQSFGKKVGISGKTVSSYETGKCTPPLKVLENISTTYNVSFARLSPQDTITLKEKLKELESAVKELCEILIQ